MLAVRTAEPRIGPQDLVVRGTSSELARLAGEIGWYEEEARKTVMLALQYKLEIGRRLARAKKLLPHGQFLSWAHEEFGWTPRHIQRHLKLVENAPRVSRLPPGTSLRMALAAISDLGSEKTEFDGTVESPLQTIRITGQIEPGTIDRDRLLEEIAKLAGELGAQKVQWKVRVSMTPPRQKAARIIRNQNGRKSGPLSFLSGGRN
jgi:hypothetical protein